MNSCPHGQRYKPLPLRRGFWRDLSKKLREGVVLVAENMPEREDVRNAAQAVLINHIASRLMKSFNRPALDTGGEFYTAFFASYMERIRAEELRIWEEFASEMDGALSKPLDRNLTETESAYLTYALLDLGEPPQSQELYMNLAVHARTYEELLRTKYGEAYSPSRFYDALRTHMPAFLYRLISMDSVMSMLLTMNTKPGHLVEETLILYPETVLDARFFELGADDSFSFRPKFIEVTHEHARAHDFTEDSHGRTEDRGCPVLYASARDAIIRFSIEELIAQHTSYAHKT